MQAGPAATGVVHMAEAWLPEVVVMYAMEAASPDGNPVIGFAQDMDAVGTTMLVGWNVSNATLPGINSGGAF
ncbi:hypothetical protein Vadar_033305 [Vaccinium darrowii]|uniref:Uncharacterized protein n=1 Tax=Vaccinium darrowii TaxID=229202 RepID=A0ACB7YRJ3_9ERIC|nr:hypothetical protein Vadar_033305 [Vaccinium darrowii]